MIRDASLVLTEDLTTANAAQSLQVLNMPLMMQVTDRSFSQIGGSSVLSGLPIDDILKLGLSIYSWGFLPVVANIHFFV